MMRLGGPAAICPGPQGALGGSERDRGQRRLSTTRFQFEGRKWSRPQSSCRTASAVHAVPAIPAQQSGIPDREAKFPVPLEHGIGLSPVFCWDFEAKLSRAGRILSKFADIFPVTREF